MRTKPVSVRWIGVTLFVALVALLPVIDLQAQNPKPVEAVSLVPCDLTALAEETFMVLDNPDTACPELVAPKIYSIDFEGNLAWMRVIVGDGFELHVYERTDSGWERISDVDQDAKLSVGTRGSHYWGEFLAAQETASLSRFTAARSTISVDGRGQTYWGEFLTEQEEATVTSRAYVALPAIAAGVEGDGYWGQLSAAQPGVAPTSQAVSLPDTWTDCRGQTYWYEFFAPQ